ncbi:MAG: hypothetical protein ACLFO2_01155 [Candidatus Woesearchaeota archaeon]
MRFDLSFKGKRLQLSLDGADASPKELKGLLNAAAKAEEQVSEPELRARVIRQLKTEILQEGDVEEVSAPGLWEVPQDLVRHKEASSFLKREADLNRSLWYEKTSFALSTVISDREQRYTLDRQQLRKSLNRLGVHERVSGAGALLARVKGDLDDSLRSEVEDFLRKEVQAERSHVVFEHKDYGSRASLELVLFGDFSFD